MYQGIDNLDWIYSGLLGENLRSGGGFSFCYLFHDSIKNGERELKKMK